MIAVNFIKHKGDLMYQIYPLDFYIKVNLEKWNGP